jgi:hypothetical protein
LATTKQLKDELAARGSDSPDNYRTVGGPENLSVAQTYASAVDILLADSPLKHGEPFRGLPEPHPVLGALQPEHESVKGEGLFATDDTEPGTMEFLAGQDGVRPPDIICDTSADPVPRDTTTDWAIAHWLTRLAQSLYSGTSPVHVRIEHDTTTQVPVTVMTVTLRPEGRSEWGEAKSPPYELFGPQPYEFVWTNIGLVTGD